MLIEMISLRPSLGSTIEEEDEKTHNRVSRKCYDIRISLCVVLGLDSGISIRHPNGKLFGAFHNVFPYAAGHGLGDRGGVSAVVHHKHLQFGNVAHYNALETIGVNITGDFIGAVTNRRVRNASLEFTADATINTSGLSPRRLNALEKVRLMASEFLCSLLYNSLLDNRQRTRHSYNVCSRKGAAGTHRCELICNCVCRSGL